MCKTEVILDSVSRVPYPIAVIAHIETTNDGPRYNQNLDPKDAKKIENLILLCPNCHSTIDNDPKGYPVAELKEIKMLHEARCRHITREHMTNLTHEIIRKIAKVLEENEKHLEGKPDYSIVPTKEKIQKNEISVEVEEYLKLGFMGVNLVKQYLNDYPNPEDIRKITSSFVWTYRELVKNGHRGDVLFMKLWDYICGYLHNDEIRSGGLAMISYFFDICEAFEK